MRTYPVVLAAVGLLTYMAAGCTHTQLRWNTVQQSRTLTDIYEQQVLNNLAMFVYDPNSLPFFSFPNAGARMSTTWEDSPVPSSGRGALQGSAKGILVWPVRAASWKAGR